MLSGWFRWQYVLPRVLLVLVALLSLQYVLGLAARSQAVRVGADLGARVDVAHGRVSATGRHVALSDLRVASSVRPAETLFEVDRVDLELAYLPLLRMETIIDRGWVTGLRVGAPRLTDRVHHDGEASPSSSTGVWYSDNSDEIAEAWIAGVKQSFDKRIVDRLESVVACNAICDQWHEQSNERTRRAQELTARAGQLQEAVDAAQANHLRYSGFFAALPADIDELRKQKENLAADIEAASRDLDAQRRAIVAARRQDEQRLRQTLRLEPIDAKAIAGYLLQKQSAAPLNEMIAWLRWARRVAPTESDASNATPNFLIRTLEMQGVANFAGQPVELRGTMTGIANSAHRRTEPMQLRLSTTGALPMTLQATIDRSGDVARDELLVDCRGVTWPALSLGDSDALRVKVQPSVGSLLVSVRVDGDKLAGEVQVVQNQVRMMPELGGELCDVPLAAPLGATLGQLNSIATRISIGGTLERPRCTLWSNLGPAVAEAFERSLRSAGDEHVKSLLAEARRRVDERLAALERQASNEQATFAAQLASVTAQLDSIAAQQSPRKRISVEQLGRRLPASSLFR
jgi:uncharacterized protein (TIGR03545 family)